MGIELHPLALPIGPNLVLALDPAALRSLGPADVIEHQRKRPVSIALIEGSIQLRHQGLRAFHRCRFLGRVGPRFSRTSQRGEALLARSYAVPRPACSSQRNGARAITR